MRRRFVCRLWAPPWQIESFSVASERAPERRDAMRGKHLVQYNANVLHASIWPVICCLNHYRVLHV